MAYMIGKKVMVAKGNNTRDTSGKYAYLSVMDKYAGKIATITSEFDMYRKLDIDDSMFWWHVDWLQPVDTTWDEMEEAISTVNKLINSGYAYIQGAHVRLYPADQCKEINDDKEE